MTIVFLLVLIVLVAALVITLVAYQARGARAARAMHRRVWAEGTPATATVIAASSNGAVNNDPRVSLTLEVSAPGRAPYRAAVTQLIDQLAVHQVAVGSRIEVRVHPVDSHVVVVDEALTPDGYH